jgi:hypothetical protein
MRNAVPDIASLIRRSDKKDSVANHELPGGRGAS